MDGCSRSSTIKTNKRPLISTVGLRRTKTRLEHHVKFNAKIYYRHKYQTFYNNTISLTTDECSQSSTIKPNKRPVIYTVGLRQTKLRLEHKAKLNAKTYYRRQCQTLYNSTASKIGDECSQSSTIKINKRSLTSTVGLRRTIHLLEHRAKYNAKYILLPSVPDVIQ